MSTLFAATHPERTAALILIGTFPREMQAPDYPWGVSEENLQRRLGLLEEEDWASAATRDWLGRVAPDILRDPEALRWYTSYVQRGASPGAARALRLMNTEIDIRDLLATISVPTLVLHRAHESLARRVSIHGRAHSGRAHGRASRRRPPAMGRRRRIVARRDRALPVGCSGGGGARPRARHAPRSPTSSAATQRRPSSATASGKTCSPSTVASCARSSPAFAGARSTRRGTASSRRSTARRARSAARRRSSDGLKALGLDVRVGVHTGEVEQATASVRGIAVDIAEHDRRCGAAGRGGSSPARSRTSSPARASHSRSAASTSWTARPAPGASSPPGSDRGAAYTHNAAGAGAASRGRTFESSRRMDASMVSRV